MHTLPGTHALQDAINLAQHLAMVYLRLNVSARACDIVNSTMWRFTGFCRD